MSDRWHKKRYDMRISMKVLLTRDMKKYKLKYRSLTTRFVSTESPVTAMVFGDYTALITWTREPVATLILSKTLASQHKTHFNELWKKASR